MTENQEFGSSGVQNQERFDGLIVKSAGSEAWFLSQNLPDWVRGGWWST
jgi:hypothetical protein